MDAVLLYFWAVLLVPFVASSSVGLNCSELDCEDEEGPRCAPGLIYISGQGCVCRPENCKKPPAYCPYQYRLELVRRAKGLPEDCCDIYECLPKEKNCSGVVCQDEEGSCPEDSYKLPRRRSQGSCCSEAQGCQCLPGPCPPPPPCPPHHRHNVAKLGTGQPGSCCPLYSCQPQESNMTCPHDGKEYSEGEMWKVNECTECKCSKGSAICWKSVKCPPVPEGCTAQIPRSPCCPVCKEVSSSVKPGGCKSGSGVIHENGASWHEDDCTSCSCHSGQMECQAALCEHSKMPGVLTVPSSCPNPDNCTLKCSHGFATDESHCLICKCKEEECKLDCPSGYANDSEGRPVCECAHEAISSTTTTTTTATITRTTPAATTCPPMNNCQKKCKHGFKRNETTGCQFCRCEHCRPIPRCSKRCPHGLHTNHRGCPVCKCRAFGPVSPIAAVNKTIEEKNGDCIIGNELRDNGEAWFDGCRQCYCLGGKEMCALVSCPKPDCLEPIMREDSCCPTCPGNDSESGGPALSQAVCQSGEGGARREGERWWLEGKRCVGCVCHGGRALCHRPACPPAPCLHPTTVDCCPVCPPHPPPLPNEQGCGVGKPAGSAWREDNCDSCICKNGTATCFTESCEQQTNSNCKTPVQIKNQCCPICLDDGIPEEETCTIGNLTFSIGEEWSEECRRCTCETGRVISCNQRMCETPCSVSACCPKCPEGFGEREWSEKAYLGVLCVVMFLLGGVFMAVWRMCCLRRHHLKLAHCQSPPPINYQYQYKYVPCTTYESPPLALSSQTQAPPLPL